MAWALGFDEGDWDVVLGLMSRNWFSIGAEKARSLSLFFLCVVLERGKIVFLFSLTIVW